MWFCHFPGPGVRNIFAVSSASHKLSHTRKPESNVTGSGPVRGDPVLVEDLVLFEDLVLLDALDTVSAMALRRFGGIIFGVRLFGGEVEGV